MKKQFVREMKNITAHQATAYEILQRAINLLEAGPLPPEHAEHGIWCPYCALALAKSEIDHERSTGIDMTELFRQAIFGFEEKVEDSGLMEAVAALGEIDLPYERDKVLSHLRRACRGQKH
jgi:hypothetical protein